jgi:hypothetical protein
MRGLDPRIHRKKLYAMDCRVKPGNDADGLLLTPLIILTTKCSRNKDTAR